MPVGKRNEGRKKENDKNKESGVKPPHCSENLIQPATVARSPSKPSAGLVRSVRRLA
jgi:hypothetical protein